MLNYIHNNVEPRMIIFLMVSIVLLTLTGSFMYVFKKPLKSYQQNHRMLELLQDEVTRGVPIDVEIAKVGQEIASLNRELHGSGPKLPVNQMIAYVIGKLDLIAGRHAVQLVSVKPDKSTRVFMFEEIPFHIEITGSYFSLFDWLHEVENELGPMIVKQFDIEAMQQEGVRRMKLVVVSYRAGEDE